MSSLLDPRNLTDREFIRLADAHLLKFELPLEWQLAAIDRLNKSLTRIDDPAFLKAQHNADRLVSPEATPHGRT
jgi:hypothetical protein